MGIGTRHTANSATSRYDLWRTIDDPLLYSSGSQSNDPNRLAETDAIESATAKRQPRPRLDPNCLAARPTRHPAPPHGLRTSRRCRDQKSASTTTLRIPPI